MTTGSSLFFCLVGRYNIMQFMYILIILVIDHYCWATFRMVNSHDYAGNAFYDLVNIIMYAQSSTRDHTLSYHMK